MRACLPAGREFEAPREQHFEVLSHILTKQIKKYTRTNHEPALGLVVTRLCLQQEVAGLKLRRSNFFAKQKKGRRIAMHGHVSDADPAGGTMPPRQRGRD